MPVPLTAKRPPVASLGEQIVVGVFVLGPLLGLWYFWKRHQNIHFDNPWANLGVHAALIVFPLIWAYLMTCKPIQFEETEEIILGTSSYFNRLPLNWWMMFMMWATPVFVVLVLGHEFFTRFLPNPESLSTAPGKALAIMVTIFCLGFFYATILFGRSEPATRISNAGLRTGLLRFHEWENIHHLSRRGDLYAIYHRVNPSLPAASFKLRDRESQATLERFLSEHHVQISDDVCFSFTLVKLGTIIGFSANLLFSVWLRLNTSISFLWIVLISFGIGIVLTILLERIRGVSKYSKYKPIIEGANEGLIEQHWEPPS